MFDASSVLMPRPRILFALAMLLVACSTSPAVVHTAQAPSAHFDRYRTFAFQSEPRAPVAFARSPQSAYVERRIEQVAAEVLRAKGYALSDAPAADLTIHVYAGRRAREVRQPERARPPWLEEDEEDDFVEGAFVIDAFDATGELVWHGSARLEIDPQVVQEDRLRRAVSDVLTSFPSLPRQPFPPSPP